MKPVGSTSAGTRRWGMVIDLNRCVGCQTCTVACKQANDTTADVQWRRVLDVEQGTFPDVERLFLVTGCQHCAEPPCVPVCPTGATRQRADGLVTMDYDSCIGCAYCAVSCPYQARTIVHEPKGYFGSTLTRQEEATAHPERRGVAQKCTFCQDRVEAGMAQGFEPGVHPEASPACAASCISQAIQFGDFNDAASHVSQLLKAHPSMQLNAELGTDPQIKYLYTTPAVPGRDEAGTEDDETLSDPANPLVGPLQTFWDWRAAMNWCFGGVGAGLAVMTGVATALGLLPVARASAIQAGAAFLMAIGLFLVFLKIGRQARFWRAFARPQSSWMSRELYAVTVFYPAVALNLAWPHAALTIAAGLAAAAFLVCQARILYKARGIPAWRAPLIPWLVSASGLLEGHAALSLCLVTGIYAGAQEHVRAFAAAGAVLTLLVAILWHRYVADARSQGTPPLARAVLERATPPLRLLGHALPLALFAFAAVGPSATALAIACAGAIAGGVGWKLVVITRAGYQQGFSLPRVPQRGSGSRAAPARLGST